MLFEYVVFDRNISTHTQDFSSWIFHKTTLPPINHNNNNNNGS